MIAKASKAKFRLRNDQIDFTDDSEKGVVMDGDDDKKGKRPSILPSLLLAKAIRHTAKKNNNDPWLNETADRLENRTLASLDKPSERAERQRRRGKPRDRAVREAAGTDQKGGS